MPRVSTVLKFVFLCLVLAILLHYRTRVVPKISHEDELEAQEGNETEVAVDLGRVTVGSVRDYLTATGRIEAAPGAAARVSSPSTAAVADVSVREGQAVWKDQPLFTLDARLADAAIAKAEQTTASDRDELARIKSAPDAPLWRVAQLEALQRADELALHSARQQKELLTIRAPLSGTVTLVQIQPGEIATPTSTAVEITDLDRLVVGVGVPPDRLAEVRVGQPVEIGLAGKKPVSSSVARVDPAIDPVTGMGGVDVPVPPAAGLRPGGFARVRIVVKTHDNVLTVPVESLTRDSADRQCIPVVIRHGRWAELIPVTVGLRDPARVEISGDGITDGTEIATSGVFAIGDKTAIRPNPVKH